MTATSSQILSAKSPTASFEATVALAAGETVDFAVGYGPDGAYFRDTTGLDARIATIRSGR